MWSRRRSHCRALQRTGRPGRGHLSQRPAGPRCGVAGTCSLRNIATTGATMPAPQSGPRLGTPGRGRSTYELRSFAIATTPTSVRSACRAPGVVGVYPSSARASDATDVMVRRIHTGQGPGLALLAELLGGVVGVIAAVQGVGIGRRRVSRSAGDPPRAPAGLVPGRAASNVSAAPAADPPRTGHAGQLRTEPDVEAEVAAVNVDVVARPPGSLLAGRRHHGCPSWRRRAACRSDRDRWAALGRRHPRSCRAAFPGNVMRWWRSRQGPRPTSPATRRSRSARRRPTRRSPMPCAWRVGDRGHWREPSPSELDRCFAVPPVRPP
jgi:hypothetical protein